MSFRRLEERDIAAATEVQIAAFVTDPAYRHIFEGHERRSLEFLFPRLMAMRIRAGVRYGVWEVDGRVVGVIAVEPSHLRIGTFAYLRHGLLLAPARLGMPATRRLLRADAALQRLKNLVRPNRAHDELLTLTVAPDHQGKGVGSQLVRAAHEHMGRPHLVLTTNAVNVPFYERFGYEIAVQDSTVSAFTTWVLTAV